MNKRIVSDDQTYGDELILVESNDRQVRVGVRLGRVRTDYVRVLNIRDGGEEAYWGLDEIAADIKDSGADPTTAFNAVLSAIELVNNGASARVMREAISDAADDLTTWLERDTNTFGPASLRPHPCAPGQVRDRLRAALAHEEGQQG